MTCNNPTNSFPVWLWSQFITTFMVLRATLSNNYSTFTAFRSLQGLFGTIPQVVGLPIIHDMYEPKGMRNSTSSNPFQHGRR